MKSLTMVILDLEELKFALKKHHNEPQAVDVLQREYQHNLNILRDYNLNWTLRPYEQWYEAYLLKNSPYKDIVEGNTLHKR